MSDSAAIGPRHRWRTTLLLETLLGALPEESDPADSWVLDAGCGRGSLGLKLLMRGHRVLAFDRDPDRVHETRDRALELGESRSHWAFVADAEAIPLRDESVAGAAAGELLEHVARDDAALAEFARVLAPTGALALTVPAGPERLGPFDRAWGHLRRYEGAGLDRLLQDAGLRVEQRRPWGWPFGRVYDALVQRPALRAQGGRAGGIVRRMGRSRILDGLWQALFGLDARLAPWAGERGSGWLVLGRKRGSAADDASRG